ncbi:MAG: SEC-C metal-binding domain-containing protein [Candidatus Sulfotelmatobacter sp.]
MRSHPREKTGRNDPCPCGSAKKYKHCCLAAQPLSELSIWQRQHDVSERLTADLLRFAQRRFDEEDIFDAWCDFNLEEFPPPIDQVRGEGNIFMPYFLYLWDPERTSRWRRPGEEGLIVSSFRLAQKGQLTEMESHFLAQAVTQPLSFYEVVRCARGERMTLRDILIGGETEVIEHSATLSVEDGDIIYGQLWNVAGLNVLGCSAPFRIPPRMLADVLVLRRKLRKKIAKSRRELHGADLVRYEDDVREAYLNIRDYLHTPPRITNTDGEALIFHTLTYEIGSAGVAFDALAPLAWGLAKEDLLRNAELDGDGAVRAIDFDWIKKGNRMHREWDNTILGRIKISGPTLSAEVNSKERAERLRKEIENRLGLLASHQSTKAQTPEELLKNAPEGTRDTDQTEEILRDPEARQQWQAMLQGHVEGWINKKIPILGGKTPLQAVLDPDGKEIVEALLREWERGGDRRGFPGGIRPDMDAVRRLLGLATEEPATRNPAEVAILQNL